MKETAKVLLLDIEEWRIPVRQASPPNTKSGIGGVNNCLDLCALAQIVSVDIAVLHHTLAPHKLRYAAEYIRRRWPDAVILAIGEQFEHLDDPLYDHQAGCGVRLEELVRTIGTSVAAKRETGRNVRSKLVNVRRKRSE
jgi:hypothetical protein